MTACASFGLHAHRGFPDAVVLVGRHDLRMDQEPSTDLHGDHNPRRGPWMVGHAIMGLAAVLFVTGLIQATTASPDDWMAGVEMFAYSTLLIGIGLVIYAALGLWVLLELLRSDRERPRGDRMV